MATDFGLDVSTFVMGPDGPDLDPTFAPITDTAAVAECLARGLDMQHSRLVDINDDAAAGFDVRRYISGKVDRGVLAKIRSGIEREALLDERVESVDVDVTFISESMSFLIVVLGETAKGPFKLVAKADAVGLTLLEAA